MNYEYQFSTWYGSIRPLQYAPEVDPANPLVENQFDEAGGIANSGPADNGAEFIYADVNGNPHTGHMGAGGIDVDNDGNTNGHVTLPLQHIPAAGCTDTTTNPLTGYNDRYVVGGNYQNIVLDMFKLGSTSMQDGGPG